MRLPAVDLDDDTLLRPHEVQSRTSPLLCERTRDAMSGAQPQEAILELRLRRRDVAQVGAKPRGGAPRQRVADLPLVPPPAELRLAHRSLQPVVIEDMGEVDEGPGDGGDRDAAHCRAVFWREVHAVVLDAEGPQRAGRRHGGKGTIAAQAPEGAGAAVAQRRPRTARQHGGEPRRLLGVRSVPDGVDASMHAVQPAAVQSRSDLASRDTGRKQLRARDEAVLRRRKRRDEPIGSVPGTHTVL